MRSLDDPLAVFAALNEMRVAGARAHNAAGEEGGLSGPTRTLIFGLNTAIDALMEMVMDP